MATPRICSIDDCDKPVRHRGWCGMHYMRWYTHGDPLKHNTSPGTHQHYIAETAVPFTGAECLIWPFHRDAKGYGKTNVNRRATRAHRFICELVHGKPPTPQHQAAHNCGNGYGGCVNPNHLSWKTPKANTNDKIEHGTAQRGEMMPTAKLTEHDVRRIRELTGTMKQKDIAAMFGVGRDCISDIQRGIRWTHVD